VRGAAAAEATSRRSSPVRFQLGIGWRTTTSAIQNETNDTIQGNAISEMFDMGVEGGGAVSNTLIANNTFAGLGTTAVGSFYCTSWTNNVIRQNAVTEAPTLALFGYQTGAFCGATQLPGVLVNNQFVDTTCSRTPRKVALGDRSQCRE
jgi:hypothetical protein